MRKNWKIVGEKRGKVVKSGEKWRKVGKSGEKVRNFFHKMDGGGNFG